MKKWLIFCLTSLISITLVACGSKNNNDNENGNNIDNTNIEEEANTNIEENVEPDIDSELNEDINVDGQDTEASTDYDFDPNSENIVTLQLEQAGVNLKLTYKADGDKLTEQTVENVMPYDSLGITSVEEAEELLSDVEASYQGIEGITHHIDYQEDKAIESITMNLEMIDTDEVSELTGVILEGDTSQGISLKKSVDMLLEQGFTIVE